MKKVLTALALAALAVGAQAQVTYGAGSSLNPIVGYNPSGTAASLLTVPPGSTFGGIVNSSISTTAGGLTATFLGAEALDLDRFSFVLGNVVLSNQGGPTVSTGPVAAGLLNFTFTDMTTGAVVLNGGNAGFASYAVLGSFANSVFTANTLGGAYDLVIGFNDGLTVDGDFDDMVIGLKVTPVPEPETYALMLAGLGALGFISRRRRKTTDA